MSNRILRACVGLVGMAMVWVAPASADVYKWVDAAGKVHFSDQPPPDGATGQKLKVAAPSATAGSAAPKAAPSLDEKERDFRKRQADKAEGASKADKEAADRKARELQCNNARGAAQALRDGVRTFEYDANGNRQYLDDAQRAQRLSEREKTVNDACK